MVRAAFRLQDGAGGRCRLQVNVGCLPFHTDAGQMPVHSHLNPGLPVGSVGGHRAHVGLTGLDAGNRPVLIHRQDLLVPGFEPERLVSGVGRLDGPGQFPGLIHIYRRSGAETDLFHRLLDVHKSLRPHAFRRLAPAGNLTVPRRHAGNPSLGVYFGDGLVGRRPGNVLLIRVLRQHRRLQHRTLAGIHRQFLPVQGNLFRVLDHLDADIRPDIASVFRDGGYSRVSPPHTGHSPVFVHSGGLSVRGNPFNLLHSGVFRKDGGSQ